jgi:hypothetical protein
MLAARRHCAGLMLAEKSRATQSVALLCAVTMVLIFDRMGDRIGDVALAEVLALLLAASGLAMALLTVTEMTVRTQSVLLELPRFDPQPWLLRIRLKLLSFSLHACALADSFVCHKAALAAPTGLLGSQLNAILLTLQTWREAVRLPRVVDALGAQLRLLIDLRQLRAAIAAMGENVSFRTPRLALHVVASMVCSILAETGSVKSPQTLNLRC